MQALHITAGLILGFLLLFFSLISSNPRIIQDLANFKLLLQLHDCLHATCAFFFSRLVYIIGDVITAPLGGVAAATTLALTAKDERYYHWQDNLRSLCSAVAVIGATSMVLPPGIPRHSSLAALNALSFSGALARTFSCTFRIGKFGIACASLVSLTQRQVKIAEQHPELHKRFLALVLSFSFCRGYAVLRTP